jgi:hypothetical protein
MDPFKPWQPKDRPRPLARPSAEQAQALALQAVAFIVADEQLLPRFLAITGCDPNDLRQRVTEPFFLGGVLDFLLADEPSLLSFTTACDVNPELPAIARQLLP